MECVTLDQEDTMTRSSKLSIRRRRASSYKIQSKIGSAGENEERENPRRCGDQIKQQGHRRSIAQGSAETVKNF